MKRSTARTRLRLAITHATRDLGLEIEGKPVLGATGQVVQVAAHRPQEAA